MQPLQILLIVTTLLILAEVTYLVIKLPRESSLKKQGRPILVDTSVLIDGRIIAVAASGFIGDTLVIPRSVVGELQFLADNADNEKRARARHGLDIVTELQNMPHVKVDILQDGSRAEEGVDERLLALAKKYDAAVCTIDYNLNKVAVVEGITILNINELAKSLRMAYLPGEKMLLELVQKGQDNHQGVGYLHDGTMVVVEHASKYIGQTMEVEFIRSLQTAAGKMMFAKLVEQKSQGKSQKNTNKPLHSVSTQQSTPAYHSDANDRHLIRSKTNFSKKSSRHAQQAHKNNKAPVSKDRESTLLDLVDRQ